MTIRNDLQYRTAHTQLRRLEAALTALEHDPQRPDVAAFQAAERSSLRVLIADLNDAIATYDALRSGTAAPLALHSVDDIPQVLIEGRIARGLSQRELAEKIGIKEQQIQRYEATNYESASLRRIIAIAHILEVEV